MSEAVVPKKRVLVIAGSDSSGGAGLEADQKVIAAHGCYALTATTALTAQNTQGVEGIHITPPAFVKMQIETNLADIEVDVVKIGMLASAETVEVVAETLARLAVPIIVLDPVMISSSGRQLLPQAAVRNIRHSLLPMTTLITPNIPEAILLLKDAAGPEAEVEISGPSSLDESIELARRIYKLGSAFVLLKGGHRPVTQANGSKVVYDILFGGEDDICVLESEFVESTNTHGTGCSLASAIASNLAKGWKVQRSVKAACQYVHAGLKHAVPIGKGTGPIHHFHSVQFLPFAPGYFLDYLFQRPDLEIVWRDFTAHEFVNRIGDGTLPTERFKFYLVQDYLYLIQFARTNALGAYKAQNINDIAASANIVLHIQREMSLHLSYCSTFNMSKADIERTKEHPACTAYSRYILDVGASGDWLALQVALAPCLIGYGVIAKRLFDDERSVREGNKYWQWVMNYVADDYVQAVETGQELLEREMPKQSPARIEELVGIFVRATELEIGFWDMGLGKSP